MADGIVPAGISLQAQHFNQYMAQVEAINKAHKEAFNDKVFADYQRAAEQMAKKTQQVNKSMESTWDVVSNLRNKLNDVGESGNKATSIFSKFNNSFKPLIGDVSQLAGEIAGLVGKFTLVAGVIKIAHDLLAFGQASIAVAQRNETLSVSLQEVGDHAGYTQDQIKLATGLLQKQGITTQAAQQSLLRMARANISWAEASKLAAIAQGSAVVAGINSSDAFERLVTGIQKQEPELLDELGITLRRDKAYEKMAQSLGVNSKQLTDAQKQQAILNSIYEQSESVLGVYDAAMGTSGKQQASLARYIEETQNNLGKLLLPLQATSVTMQTQFWKAAQKLTQALQPLAPLLGEVIPSAFGPLIDAFKSFFGLSEDFDFVDKLAEGIFNFSKLAVLGFTTTRTAGQVAVKQLTDNWNNFFTGMAKGWTGDFLGSAKAFGQVITDLSDTGNEFTTAFNDNLGKVLEAYPDLMKSWSEVTKGVEGDSEDLRLAQDDLASSIEEASKAIEQQIQALEATKDAYNKIKGIQENFQDAQAQAKEDYEKGLADAEKKYLDERAKKIAEFNKKLAEFDADSAKKRAKMIDEFEIAQQTRVREFALQQAQAQKEYDLKVGQDKSKFYDEQRRQLRAFQLSQMQEMRRFQVTDRRLRADGDVLALMEARENFALDQQEKKENFDNAKLDATDAYEEQRRQARENFDLQQQMAKDSFALQTELQREEFQRRLQEFDANIAEQRTKMQEAHAQELVDLEAKYEEEKIKLKEQYDERMAMAQEQRDKQLQALGDSLKEEGVVTEEGMKEIASKISEVFGDEGAGDQLIQGWGDRSKNEINNVVDAISEEIARLKAQLESVGAGGGMGAGSSSPGVSAGASAGFGNNPSTITGGGTNPPIGARSGFNGVVTGPKTFQVEPGVREHVAFTPMNRFGGNINIQGSTQHNITGASPEVADRIANEIAETLVGGIRIAVKKLGRRVG